MADIGKMVNKFKNNGEFKDAIPFGSGHINDTFLVTFNKSGKTEKFILRKINRFVFKEPELIVENTINITNHIKKKLLITNESDINRKVLTLIQTVDGKNYFLDDEQNYWCFLLFIDDAYTVNYVETETQAFEAAKAYGKFQSYLLDFDITKCHTTIKNFHNLSDRFSAYKKAIEADPKNRVENISSEIKKINTLSWILTEFTKLNGKNLPVRITHNDTKINNVMLDKNTNEGLCVVDLDTVMPGTILNDFGDMVRTFTSPALEDEKEFSKVKMRLGIFEALVKGFLSELKNNLIPNEINNLVLGAKIIVYEQAVRFLTDYINGDIYYKIEYETHNLNRTKNQLALLESIIEQSEDMQIIVEKYSR